MNYNIIIMSIPFKEIICPIKMCNNMDLDNDEHYEYICNYLDNIMDNNLFYAISYIFNKINNIKKCNPENYNNIIKKYNELGKSKNI